MPSPEPKATKERFWMMRPDERGRRRRHALPLPPALSILTVSISRQVTHATAATGRVHIIDKPASSATARGSSLQDRRSESHSQARPAPHLNPCLPQHSLQHLRHHQKVTPALQQLLLPSTSYKDSALPDTRLYGLTNLEHRQNELERLHQERHSRMLS